MKVLIYKVNANDTVSSITKKLNILPSQIAQKSFCEGDRIVINLECPRYYIVMPGDTPSKIAKKMQISEEHLNEILGTSKIFVGKHIVI